MADITNPEAVRFCNEVIRPLANAIYAAYKKCREGRDEFVANNMGSLLPDTADLVVDGSATDGRHPITGEDVNNIVTLANELLTNYEADTNAKLNELLNVCTNEYTA